MVGLAETMMGLCCTPRPDSPLVGNGCRRVTVEGWHL